MFIYGPGEHQFGELDYAWVEKNELRIRTRAFEARPLSAFEQKSSSNMCIFTPISQECFDLTNGKSSSLECMRKTLTEFINKRLTLHMNM